MRIGYPCMCKTLQLTTSNTTRLKSLTPEKVKTKLQQNLNHLKQILKFNAEQRLLFFRMGSEFVPFASHAQVRDPTFQQSFHWKEHFKNELAEIGQLVKTYGIRLSMHPDQFVLLNSPDLEIFEKSVQELQYHADLMDAMQLDSTHKFQIHLGGRYDDKKKSMQRFVDRYLTLSESIKARLVLENDDRLFSLEDVLWVHEQCGIPILFDTLHHECLNTNGESLEEAFLKAAETWDPERDGPPMIDYSDQEPKARVGKHRSSIQVKHFKKMICDRLMKCKWKKNHEESFIDFDVMLEIKDKDLSAKKVLEVFEKGVAERENSSGEPIEEGDENDGENKEDMEQQDITPRKEKQSKQSQKKRKESTSTRVSKRRK
ncbi:hypothetical protein C9374_001590 [Naegleria lovaniensis]|uniref:Uncharacterized protein n=1 Tax=Naegleria lovaniensis TaxID=51637 RepID=A0AA88GVU2_NAELO|nr:uncharacterized protein C9374_001590 [Naegleria lovaniensis]KAG2387258.1 hypothetical protein C9374_001590 [Naegleria lovaniensis]